MTLVANFSVSGWPILVGDIMISSPRRGRESKPFNIPTHANVNARAILVADRLVSGLVQKVTILTPRLAIAWAGSSLCAGAVFQEILERSDPPEFHQIISIFDEWKNEPGINLHVTGIHIGEHRDNKQVIRSFAWNSDNGWEAPQRTLPNYGYCYAGGTGAESILNLLSASSITDLSDTATSFESAICQALAHLGKLAGDQLRLSLGVDLFFGGGFEIATFLDGQLQKIGDVSYHFWEARSAPNSQLTITFHILLRVTYFEDYLVIRKIEFASDTPNTAGADELYVIAPVHRTVSQSERMRLESKVPLPSLNTRFNVFYVHFPEVRGENCTYISVHKSKAAEHSEMVKFEETNGEITFEIHHTVMERINNALIKRTTGSIIS